MDDREEYLLMRRRKKIRLNTLAAYIGCSQSLLSRYELYQCNMSEDKIQKYKKYIKEN